MARFAVATSIEFQINAIPGQVETEP